ncbi:MAG TPA: hypothetical protein PLC61_04710 [Chitinophagales bacterium]|nr:hypothetical protein [Chitinophagales bacterium]
MVKKTFSLNNLEDIFTKSAYYTPAYTLSGLFSFQRKNESNSTKKKLSKMIFLESKNKFALLFNLPYASIIREIAETNSYDLDIPLYAYSIFEPIPITKTKTIQSIFN